MKHVERFFRQAATIAGKDLAIELSTGEIVTTSGFFAAYASALASATPTKSAPTSPGP